MGSQRRRAHDEHQTRDGARGFRGDRRGGMFGGNREHGPVEYRGNKRRSDERRERRTGRIRVAGGTGGEQVTGYDWVTPFETATGCKVTVKVGLDSGNMVQLMKTGQYDGVSASGDATLRLIAGGDVSPVNLDLIPNYKDVFEGLKNQSYNTVDGQSYGVPHGRGA